MSLLVVGSIALDTIETPFGNVSEVLGGSAAYFALAASIYNGVSIVGVVGDDFPREHISALEGRGIDLTGLKIARGKTFRWVGRYGFDLNTATTVDTQLNVFADFQPVPPDGSRDAEIIFLANIDPVIQREVLRQINSPRLTMLDTMNYWIEAKPKELTQAMAEVDLVTMNESEIRQWARDYSIIAAAKKILNLGAKAVVVKKGEYGSFLLSRTGYFLAPAYPLEEMKDPTGAGDSFAGGFLGYLSTVPEVNPLHLRRAIIHGNVVASFAVEDFGVNRLLNLTRAEVAARYLEFRTFTQFEEP